MNQRWGKTTTPDIVRPVVRMLLLLLPLASSALAQDLDYTLAPYNGWTAVACSADGKVLAAAARRPYISTNSGAIWTPTNPLWAGTNLQPVINYVALTPDASTLVAIGFSNAYSSHDLGVTWKTNSLPGENVVKVAISDDGTKWICANTANYTPYSKFSSGIYASSDSGASWQLTGAPITNWTLVALSGDGDRLAAVYGSNQVYISADRGVTWTNTMPASPTNSFSLIVTSSDGNKLVAIGNGIICVSTNGGALWDTVGTPPGNGVLGVAASAGANTIALASEDQIFTSTNSGSIWEQRVPKVAGLPYQPPFPSIALSADGKRLLEATDPGLVFTSPLPPAVLSVAVLNYPPSQSTWAISWPSNQIGFVLESTPTLFPAPRWTAVTNYIDPYGAIITNIIYPGGYRHIIVVTNAIGAASAFYRLHKPYLNCLPLLSEGTIQNVQVTPSIREKSAASL